MNNENLAQKDKLNAELMQIKEAMSLNNMKLDSLYNELEKKGAWNVQDYLAEFNKHQAIIPERCWLADYQRKYLRPRQLGLDQQTYLDRLEGGRKTHQRT